MGWCGMGAVKLTSQKIHVNMLELYLCNNSVSLGGNMDLWGGGGRNIPWSPPSDKTLLITIFIQLVINLQPRPTINIIPESYIL